MVRSFRRPAPLGAALLLSGLAALVPAAAGATVITFDDQGLTGPSRFGDAGGAQTLLLSTADGDVLIAGGVVLAATSNLPANQTAVYGTASFGDPTYTNPLTITFAAPVSGFFLDVLNGNIGSVDYELADDAGNRAVFTLPPNLSGGQTRVGFAATGTVVTILALTVPPLGLPWNFFIDNVHFNERLPVPEPAASTLWLVALGAAAAARRLRIRTGA